MFFGLFSYFRVQIVLAKKGPGIWVYSLPPKQIIPGSEFKATWRCVLFKMLANGTQHLTAGVAESRIGSTNMDENGVFV